MTHFISSRRQRKRSNSLIHIKQKEEKLLRSYLGRFNAAILKVRNLDQSVVMTALKDRLLKNRLRYSLEKSYPCDFADMLARVEKYAWADEAFEG